MAFGFRGLVVGLKALGLMVERARPSRQQTPEETCMESGASDHPLFFLDIEHRMQLSPFTTL